MWYLYMIVGLYLLTPILKPIIENCSASVLSYFLILLFLFDSIFPLIEELLQIKLDFEDDALIK